uniref:acyltransferase n=1 Tax=Algoriphagus sp. TaxID=1872435 RepID=UPI004048ACAF
MKKKIKNRFPFIFSKYLIFRKIGLGNLIINYFIKIFRKNNNFNFSLHYTSQITFPKKFEFENDYTTLVSLAVSGNCYFQANNGIKLGKNCLIAPGVKIISSNHDYITKNIVLEKPIFIGDDVWIGTNVVILPGVTIGSNVVIGAGSIVTKSFEQGNIVLAGNPASIIKFINEKK